MGRKYKPLTSKEVKKILRGLGFEFLRQNGTAHERWIGKVNGVTHHVTVSSHLEPFKDALLQRMIHQSGHSKQAWYAQLGK